MLLTVRHGAINAALLTLYRPGSRPITDESFTEFADVLERCSKYCRCYIVGDINIHLDDVSSPHTSRLQQLLHSFGLHDCVRQPTHNKNHQLDIFTTSDSERPLSLVVQPPTLSDHALIVTTVDTRAATSAPASPRVRRRCWATFNREDFISELGQSQLVLSPPDDVDELFQC